MRCAPAFLSAAGLCVRTHGREAHSARRGAAQGVDLSMVLLLFLTDGVLQRPFVQKEVRHAPEMRRGEGKGMTERGRR